MTSRQIDDQITLQTQQEKLLNPALSVAAPAPLWFSKRLLVTVLMFVCYVNVAFIRCSISIAVVEMTSNKSIETDNSTTIQSAEFAWDSKTVGFVLSAFYYGGLGSLIGGYVVTKLGGAIGCAFSLMLCGTFTVLHPISLYQDFSAFIICRLLAGFSESFLIVSIAQICSKWIPQNEKSKLISFAVNGTHFGSAIVYPISAFLAHQWGWQMVFYATGTISLITSLLCFIFVPNQPSEDSRISRKELAYIQERTTVTAKKMTTHPYKKILLSAPVWALILSQFVVMWMWAIQSTLLPLYVKDMTQDGINNVGLISSFPSVVNIFMLPLYGILLDYTKKFDISQTKMHKILVSATLTMMSIIIVGTALISNFVASVISFTLLQILISFVHLISQIIIVSIAPNSTSVIAALCTFTYALSSISARSATGFMTMSHSLEEWNHCFILAGSISFLGALIFTLYGSSEAQPWSTSPEIAKK